MPRELCSSESAMLSFSRGIGGGQSMRRRIRRASRRVGIGSVVGWAALTLWVSFAGYAQDGGGFAPSSASTDGGSSAASIVVIFGGDVTLGYHYEEYFDDQLSKGRTREEMLAYPFKELNGRLRAAGVGFRTPRRWSRRGQRRQQPHDGLWANGTV